MTAPLKQRLGVLLSGRGSNFLNIADAIETGRLTGCEIACVISNIADAPGLQAAHDRDLTTETIVSKGVPRAEHDAKMVAALQQHGIDLVILAGYMRVLSPEFIRAFPDRILNIHPSLLPSFPGLHAQAQALEYGATIAGCTVHFVDEAVDHGVIVLQRAIPVLDGDTAETLSTRILAEEHIAYPDAIQRVLSGRYAVQGRRYIAR
ncbi:phosphoribosylglycinamide formyltransferase [Terriglobus roseus]|uniref:Phosphoribosylglycinamide formyltransferase n=1 Tax=Terriglobus roseus TaxID=392734 RepID=A0A1H4KHS7_9BACT|nr:phosphoribosylglycinamide formyltransferase [Terriglobus roseus]SEB57472.1 formyltetrahydrofolate-dependent phosphoribosylglycinamide formyltransferase [Terriglobus roseus]